MKEEEYEYIKVRKDLYEKYGFSNACVIQALIECGEYVGKIQGLSDKIGFLSRDLVRKVLADLTDCGAIEQIKVTACCYRIVIKDLTLVKKRYTKKKKTPKNQYLRSLVEQIEKDKKKKLQ